MKVKYIAPDKLIPYAKNAKKHSAKQVEQIAMSIKEFGFNQPIVVDKDNVVIVGHGRLTASVKILQLDKVPYISLDLTEEQAKSYRLADNKLNESDWDMDLVINELKELSLSMVDLTGFDRDLLVDPDDKDDIVPFAPKKPLSKIGDVYELGAHKIICGDSTIEEDVVKLMANQKADMVFTDPPYNVDYSGRGKKTSQKIENDNMGSGEFDTFLCAVFRNYRKIIKESAGLYVFHSSSTQNQFQEAIKKAGMIVKSTLIWNKPTASMGWADYRWKHEPFYYAGVEDKKTKFYGDRTNSTILDFQNTEEELVKWAKRMKRAEKDGKTTIWTMKRDNVQEYVHPTQKPVELITYALINSSKAEDIVVDLFLGSGSTLIGCEKANRVCYGMELDPKFVDVIVQRYCDYVENYKVIKNGKQITWKKN